MPSWLTDSYLWYAALADLNRRIGRLKVARTFQDEALGLAPTSAIRTLLKQRFQRGITE